MESLTSSSLSNWVVPSSSQPFLRSSNCLFQTPFNFKTIEFPFLLLNTTTLSPLRFSTVKTRATLDEKDQISTTPVLVQDEQEQKQISTTPVLVQDEQEQKQPIKEVEESVKLLKTAAKTRKVPAEEILSAFSVIEKAKLDPSGFLETLGGMQSPGRTWMLIFTAKKQLEGGTYFPITAVQRFDASANRIENGVYLGSLGSLTFEGKLSWKNRILAFIFERVRVKIGPFNPFEISIKEKDEREPSNKDPFFIWFYVDEEIAVARGRSGGTAFWVRCQRVSRF